MKERKRCRYGRSLWLAGGLGLLVLLLVTGSSFAQKPDKTKEGKLPEGCTVGQVAKWDPGTETWVCAADDDTITDISQLAQRISDLENASQSLFFEVDCGAGQTVEQALAQTEGRPVTIRIVGVCEEGVEISENVNDVTLEGAMPGDGLLAPATETVVNVNGSNRVVLRQLTLQGGHFGLAVGRGAKVTGTDLRITGAADSGLFIFDASLVLLSNSLIEDSVDTGVFVRAGGDVVLTNNTVVRNNGLGVNVTGGSAQITQSTVEGNGIGIFATAGASVDVRDTDIIFNTGTGITLHDASLLIGSNSVIADNARGLSMFGGGAILGQVRIEHNSGDGVIGQLGSTVSLAGGIIIQLNTNDGIRLGDTSVVGSQNSGGIQITGNRRGIFCEPTPAVAAAQITTFFENFTLNATHVFGNLEEDINCPGISVP